MYINLNRQFKEMDEVIFIRAFTSILFYKEIQNIINKSNVKTDFFILLNHIAYTCYLFFGQTHWLPFK